MSSEITWVLFDSPISKEVISWAELQRFTWLYDDTVLAGAMEVSPLLVKVINPGFPPPSRALDKAVFIETNSDEKDFLDHLRSLVLMSCPDGRPYVIRFYSPTYLSAWLTKFSDQSLSELMGCIYKINWKVSGRWKVIVNPKPHVAVNSDVAWFSLSKEEWELLQVAYKNKNLENVSGGTSK